MGNFFDTTIIVEIERVLFDELVACTLHRTNRYCNKGYKKKNYLQFAVRKKNLLKNCIVIKRIFFSFS